MFRRACTFRWRKSFEESAQSGTPSNLVPTGATTGGQNSATRHSERVLVHPQVGHVQGQFAFNAATYACANKIRFSAAIPFASAVSRASRVVTRLDIQQYR